MWQERTFPYELRELKKKKSQTRNWGRGRERGEKENVEKESRGLLQLLVFTPYILIPALFFSWICSLTNNVNKGDSVWKNKIAVVNSVTFRCVSRFPGQRCHRVKHTVDGGRDV